MQLQLNLTLDRTFAEFGQIKNTKKRTKVDNDMMHVENDIRQSTLIHTFFSIYSQTHFCNLVSDKYAFKFSF